MTLKGFNNVSFVTGGIEEFGAIYKEFLEGNDIPDYKLPEGRKLSRKKDPFEQTREIQKNT